MTEMLARTDRAAFPSAFTVLREHLGLKMEATKAPV